MGPGFWPYCSVSRAGPCSVVKRTSISRRAQLLPIASSHGKTGDTTVQSGYTGDVLGLNGINSSKILPPLPPRVPPHDSRRKRRASSCSASSEAFMGLLGQLDEVHKSWMAEAEELRQENVRLREQIQTMEQTTTPCKGLDDETVDTMCTTSPPHPLQQASSEDTESTNAAKEFASGFKLRQEWGAMHPDDPSHLKQFRNNIKISISNLDDSPRLEIDDGGGGSIWHQFICFPTSRWRMFWDIIGGVFIFL